MIRGLKDVIDFIIVSNVTGKPVIKSDYARTSSIDYTSEAVYARNKTTNAIRWNKNREGTLKTSCEVFDMKMLAMLFGKEISTGTVPFMKSESLKVSSGTATLVGTPKTGTLKVFKSEAKDPNFIGVEQTVGTPATTENAYSIASSTITLNATSCPDDSYIICFYTVDTSCNTFTVNSTSFPGGYSIYGDTFLRDTDEIDKLAHIQFYKVKPQSNVSLSMDADNVATLEITWDILPDAKGDMMTFSWVD